MSGTMDKKEIFFGLLHETIVLIKRTRANVIICKKIERYTKKKKKLLIERDLINGLIEDYEKQYVTTI